VLAPAPLEKPVCSSELCGGCSGMPHIEEAKQSKTSKNGSAIDACGYSMSYTAAEAVQGPWTTVRTIDNLHYVINPNTTVTGS
jgi:hypothetical protein